MTPADLKFDNANNSSMSLHAIAEWVRIGDMKVVQALIGDEDCRIELQVWQGPRPKGK